MLVTSFPAALMRAIAACVGSMAPASWSSAGWMVSRNGAGAGAGAAEEEDDLEAMKKKLEQMEEEAAKLNEMKEDLDKQLGPDGGKDEEQR